MHVSGADSVGWRAYEESMRLRWVRRRGANSEHGDCG